MKGYLVNIHNVSCKYVNPDFLVAKNGTVHTSAIYLIMAKDEKSRQVKCI